MSAKLKNSAVATGLEKSIFISISKKGNAKQCSIYHTVALISHASKVMFKSLQTRLQQWIENFQMLKRFQRGTRDQTANIHWIIEKAVEFQKNIYFSFIDFTKAFDSGSQTAKENS